ncbi:MAG: hypothetical protein DWH81_02975 [Planctomycetota bacterium]|nr:MAG: hypothetical protein DWH81_02975 [Planctomycetota bacterium]
MMLSATSDPGRQGTGAEETGPSGRRPSPIAIQAGTLGLEAGIRATESLKQGCWPIPLGQFWAGRYTDRRAR